MPDILEDYFKTEASKFIIERNGEVVVDWQALHKFRMTCDLERDGSKSYNPVEHSLIDILLERGILTHDHRESWTLTDGMADLSPSKGAPCGPAYFTRKEDAEAYRDAFYRYLAIPAHIRKASETI